MISVTVELVPFGMESKKETISQIDIGNTGVKDERGDAIYIYHCKGWVKNESTGNSMLDDRFQNEEFEGKFHHDRRDGLFVLIYRMINAVIIPRKDIKY